MINMVNRSKCLSHNFNFFDLINNDIPNYVVMTWLGIFFFNFIFLIKTYLLNLQIKLNIKKIWNQIKYKNLYNI